MRAKIINKLVLVVFTGLILFPSALDVAHLFSGHQHIYCDEYADAHFHQNDLDCELFDFQKSPFPTLSLFSHTFFNPEISSALKTREYLFLDQHDELSFSLRGPPETV